MSSSNTILKEVPNIHTIPEDLAQIIVKLIKGWAEERGSLEQKESGRKARDSTLLGIALSCRQGKDLYYDHLLENLTFSPFTINSVYELLHYPQQWGLEGPGPKVKSLLCLQHYWNFNYDDDDDDEFDHYVEVAGRSGFGHREHASEAERQQYQQDAYESAVTWLSDCIYQKLDNLETLIIENPMLGFHFLTKTKDGIRPQKFLAHSLKKLYFMSSARKQFSITAKNALFLLCHCNSLEQAALGFDLGMEDFSYLTEYSETFKRLSNVTDLAIGFAFVYGEKDPIWSESHKYVGRNQKTETIYHFLLVTNQLHALEVNEHEDALRRDGDRSLVQTDFLKALSTSTSSLRRFRCLMSSAKNLASNLSLFKNLDHLSLLPNGVLSLLASAQMLPSNLSIISMVYYSSYQSETKWVEDDVLLELLKTQISGNFTEVVLPEVPIDGNGEVVEVDREIWLRKRRALEESEVFKSGKFSLTRYRVGDVVGSKCTENSISALRWLGP